MTQPLPPHRHATDAQIASAARKVREEFPIEGYLNDWSSGYVYPWLAKVVNRHMPPGAKVLDFGAGPGDYAVFLSKIGYRCTACDDMQDPWHLEGDNQQKILDYSRRAGVDFRIVTEAMPWQWPEPTFDLVLAHHVFEHIRNSPRPLLNLLIGSLREGGVLLVAVPNAANLRKRLAILCGKTNYPPFAHFYWYEGEWRGHCREYVRDDLEQLVRHSGLELRELGFYHALAGLVSPRIRAVWKAATLLCPSGRDSLYVVARKPVGWKIRSEVDPGDPEVARLRSIRH